MHTITLEEGLATFLNALPEKTEARQPSGPIKRISCNLSRFSMLITCRFIPRQRLRKLMWWSISPRLPRRN